MTHKEKTCGSIKRQVFYKGTSCKLAPASAATENQKKFIAALNAGSISNITPRGPQTKLTLLGLVHGQSFNPSKIKSYRLFGSNAGTKTVKKLLKLF